MIVRAIIASLIFGFILGLVITWGFLPVQFANANPAQLRPSLKNDYIQMIGATYAVDGDLAAARQRLIDLGFNDPIQSVNTLVAQNQPNSGNVLNQDILIRLAQDLAAAPAATAVPTAAGGTSAAANPAGAPTGSVPTVTLVDHTQLTCAAEPNTAHLYFNVRDANGQGLPNVGIEIRWANGDETIYTGLKPEQGPGYADLEVTPGQYSVTIVHAQGDTVSGLIVGEAPGDCKTDNGATPRGWKLVFEQK